MHDPKYGWDPDMPEDTRGSGLLGQTARNMGILVAGCLLVVGALSQFGRAGDAGPEPAPEAAREPSVQQAARSSATGDELLVRAGPNGQFMVDAVVDGVEIRFLVDTGATRVVLTAEDAERLGYRLDGLDYSERYQTANGEILGAPVVLPELRIGDLEIEDVRSSVIRAPLSTSLLGMTFLSRLESFEVRDEGLILRW
ncbi:MAG: TIGR02281 family clan AA aspartic protease [Proteobacteria bacterium]|nr:TIGR02281 family clan AA aspartic protease [Pseudomonadota bacterium]